jgi:2-iminoacetate synthase ThiH
MAFMKYLTPFSGKEDSEGWLESYESAAKAEKWTTAQMLAGLYCSQTEEESQRLVYQPLWGV